MLTQMVTMATAGSTLAGPSPEQIYRWLAIGGIVIPVVIWIVVKAVTVDRRWVHKDDYDKQIEELKEAIEAAKEQNITDTARRDKLMAKLEALTEAIDKHYKR